MKLPGTITTVLRASGPTGVTRPSMRDFRDDSASPETFFAHNVDLVSFGMVFSRVISNFGVKSLPSRG